MDTPFIIPVTDHPTVTFAAHELSRYLARALETEVPVTRDTDRTEALRIGMQPDFEHALPDAPEPSSWKDSYTIRTEGGNGHIIGSNPRATLLAAYRYLTELGFRWVRPGPTGERIPELQYPLPPITLAEQASYTHRGVCIEGAVSEENVLDMVDWLPKLGFNGYFIQFREAFNFYQRWYEHQGNPSLPKTTLTIDQARQFTRRLRGAIKKRDLLLHMVGHGWTCEPFGIPGPGWFPHEGEIPEDATPFLAEVNGKRELWGNIALNTNLCYGNPQARDRVVNAIAQWATENPDVDIIHFWLADGSNNQCECPLCRDHRPADLYVQMLNELDRVLTEAGIPVKIVFLVYVDLLWPPVKQKLRNPDRFILMFAPITRSYSAPFATNENAPAELPPFKRNQLTFPKEPEKNLAFLNHWRDMFPGDSFDFDYHFMWDHHKDPGQYTMAKILHQDCKRLRNIGLDGFMSCQNQRVFFPTGLGMTAMGKTLWNRELTFENIEKDYFQSAFGPNWEQARDYLARISHLFHPVLIRGEGTAQDKESAIPDLEAVPEFVASMTPAIAKGIQNPVPCWAESWRLLELHTTFATLYADALREAWTPQPDGGETQPREAANRLIEWVRQHEMRLQPVFDAFEFLITVAPILGIARSEIL